MNTLRDSFWSWVRRQTIADKCGRVLDDDHIMFEVGHTKGHVIFLTQDEEPLVELRVGELGICEAPFLTHFVLKDRWRPRELFRDMAHALTFEANQTVRRIVVCGTNDKADQDLVERLRALQNQTPLPCEFEAMPASVALNEQRPVTAMLLSPDASTYQRRLFNTHRHAVTFCLPTWVYESQDARAAINLLLEALGEPELHATKSRPAEPVRPLAQTGRILVLNVMYRDRSVRMGYRLYDNGIPGIRGAVTKPRVSMQDINDLFDTLEVQGVPRDSVNAVGIMVPGVVNFCSMNLPSLGGRDYEIVEKLEQAYGIPAFIDNNTNAAAMGCYYVDPDHESLTLYRHQLGHKNGGQGTVIGGQLITGRYGLAGEPKFYQRHFKYDTYDDGYTEAVWSERGLSEVAKNVLLATIGTVSPEVAYLAVNSIDDVCGIGRALEHKLPKYCIPELVSVKDYRDRMYLGEVALCLSRLAAAS